MGAGLNLNGLDQFKASALLDATAPAKGAPLQVSLSLIEFDPAQPRRTIDDATVAELAASIKVHGVLEPVSLRTHPIEAARYRVNRGERRVRAARLAGLLSVPAFIDERIDPYAQAIENLQREDLSPFDLARFIADREAEGDSRAAIARKLHKPASFITEVAELIDPPAEVRAAFEAGRVRDTRVLYQLARGLRENRAGAELVLRGEGAITRESIESLADVSSAQSAAEVAPPEGRRVQGTKHADALLVEHAGRRGRLGWAGWPGRRTGEVRFDDGSRQVLELAELKLIAWTAR